jgi:hypothetical protein
LTNAGRERPILQRTRSLRPPGWIAYAACAWAFGHASLSLYWAAGGTAGLGTLSEGIQEMALARDPSLVALVWLVAVLKILAGLLALALARPWGRRLPQRPLRVLAWLGGAGMTLYGVAWIVQGALVSLGVVGSAASVEPAFWWYLFLWAPVWLLGGLLFVLTAWAAAGNGRRTTADRRGPGNLSRSGI